MLSTIRVSNCLFVQQINLSPRLLLPLHQIASRSKGTTTQQCQSLSRTRNIGIIAHIDAGKTTTTERMLYYSGLSNHLGNVDDGDTVTDYLAEERERGITITSAVVTFGWDGHSINLVDTPGHIDFTMEVERCLRVLDGAVTVVDASRGVEAQTVTVSKQADRYGIPRIVFVNKMDKHNADFNRAVESLKSNFSQIPLVIQLPVGQGAEFKGIIDVVAMKKYIWDERKDTDGTKYVCEAVLPGHENFNYTLDARLKLVEVLADFDNGIGDAIISGDDYRTDVNIFSMDRLNEAVSIATRSGSVAPVLCGSARRNKAIQPLLNAINLYLPPPQENIKNLKSSRNKDLLAFVFKIIHDDAIGPLVFVRIYSGTISTSLMVRNVTQSATETVYKLYRMSANQRTEIETAGPGSIIAVTGLDRSRTGDTLCNLGSRADNLGAVVLPQPVFYCHVEASSLSKEKRLMEVLSKLCREDPSLNVKVNSETNQIILTGMGELHMDIVKHKLLNDYKLDVYIGPIQVAYKETVRKTATVNYELDKTLGETKHKVKVELSVDPSTEVKAQPPVINMETLDNVSKQTANITAAVRSGIMEACTQGPVNGYPVVDILVSVKSISVLKSTSMAMISAAASNATHNAVSQGNPVLIEPTMVIRIRVPELYRVEVIDDIACLHGNVLEVEYIDETEVVIEAEMSLSLTLGYASRLRSLTRGCGSFTLQFSHYEAKHS